MPIQSIHCERTHYLIHGVRLMVMADDDSLRAAAHDVLRPFSTLADHIAANETTAPRCDIRMRLSRSSCPGAIPEGTRVWIEQPPVVCRASESGDAYVELDGRYVAYLDAARGDLDGWFPSDLTTDTWMLGHAVLLPLLLEALRRRGWHSLHAAAVAHSGRVAVFPAGSGSGKTTLTLALVRAGFRLLSDDTPLLRCVDGRVRVYAFPEPVNVMARTCEFFPELRSAFETGVVRRAKSPVDCAAIYGDCIQEQGTPGAIIFPRIGESARTVVQPLEPSAAVLRLLSAVLPSTSPEGTAAQFALLSDLARDTPCFQMQVGRDFDDMPNIIVDLLDGRQS